MNDKIKLYCGPLLCLLCGFYVSCVQINVFVIQSPVIVFYVMVLTVLGVVRAVVVCGLSSHVYYSGFPVDAY